VPGDQRFAALRDSARDSGVASVAGRRAAYERLAGSEGNANDWLVVAVTHTPAPSLLGSFGAGSIGMIFVAILLLAFTLLSARAGNLRAEAQTDSLTGLANRRQFLRRLERAIRHAARHEGSAALLMLDLDRFKELNDTLGHHVGDLLLAQFGPRLRDAVREADTLARLGGDEFAVLLTELTDCDAAGRVFGSSSGDCDRSFRADTADTRCACCQRCSNTI